MFTHAVLLDGQVLGHWRRRVTRKGAGVDLHIARPLGRAERDAIGDAVNRCARFFGFFPGTQ
jgi:hypothetical protein